MNLEALLRRVAEALYYIGFEACPRNVNTTRVQELYFEVERVLNASHPKPPQNTVWMLEKPKHPDLWGRRRWVLRHLPSEVAGEG